MIYRVIVTPNAEADLRQAYHFIQKDSPGAAVRWARGARRSIKSLLRNPERCPLAPEAASLNETIRELLYGRGNRGTYRILFVVDGAKVYVLHVRHGSMEILGVQGGPAR
jgi:plasmid stabilization system protein ParE